MNTTSFTTNNNLSIAENYYKAMLAKDFKTMASFLHKNVHFIGPLDECHGKEAITLAATNFGKILQNVEIHSRFSNNNQIMLTYEMTVPGPAGKFRAAVLMEITDQLISRIELFYDSRPFFEMKEEIFGNNKESN